MPRLTENKIVLIQSKTRLEELIIRYNTVQQAKFHIEHMGSDFSDYRRENDLYHRAVSTAHDLLSRLGRVQVVDRSFLPNYLFGHGDSVVVVGRDGLVANTLKYLSGQPVIGVNSDPERWDGILSPFTANELFDVLQSVYEKKAALKQITMAKASLSDGQVLYGVNDLFIGQKTHVSARYELSHSGRSERQSSSGIIVSTGLGSTGWLKSVMAGARAVNGFLGSPAPENSEIPFDSSKKRLYFSVREPFPSRSSGAEIGFGRIVPRSPLEIRSEMPENGVIFSDGIEKDYLKFNSGVQATISVAEKSGSLVVRGN